MISSSWLNFSRWRKRRPWNNWEGRWFPMQDQCLILDILFGPRSTYFSVISFIFFFFPLSWTAFLINQYVTRCTGLQRKQQKQNHQICECSREKKGEKWSDLWLLQFRVPLLWWDDDGLLVSLMHGWSSSSVQELLNPCIKGCTTFVRPTQHVFLHSRQWRNTLEIKEKTDIRLK